MRTRTLLPLLMGLSLLLPLHTTGQSLPERLSDEAFRQLIADFSEPGGSFQREWMSNEEMFKEGKLTYRDVILMSR